MAVTFFIVPDFETGYSGFIFGIISGRIILHTIVWSKNVETSCNKSEGRLFIFLLNYWFFLFFTFQPFCLFFDFAQQCCATLLEFVTSFLRCGDFVHSVQFKNNICLQFDLRSTRSIDFVGPWPSDDFTEYLCH